MDDVAAFAVHGGGFGSIDIKANDGRVFYTRLYMEHAAFVLARSFFVERKRGGKVRQLWGGEAIPNAQ